MSASPSDPNTNESSGAGAAPVPKPITNAQTVCNERNEKGKLCNGHLKQLQTAGEASEVHLRGDDVLFKCQTCGTLYMGPPLGHVRDPGKQYRFVEAELSALLQAAGGTLPVIKKDERGVFIMVETDAGHGHAAKPAVPKPSATAPVAQTKPTAAAPSTTTAAPPPAKPLAGKGEAQPDRKLMKRYTYSGFTDTGPVSGESFAQKVERLKALAAAAKRRSDEGGSTTPAAAASTSAAESAAPPSSPPPPAVEQKPPASGVQTPPQPSSPPAGAPGSGPNRSLMKRYTYAGVIDTGPVPGETFEQKVERLRQLSAAAKRRSEGG